MQASPKRSALLSGFLHAAAIALVLLATSSKTINLVREPHTTIYIPSDLKQWISHPTREGGGGGGVRDPLPATAGPMPRMARRQYVPPVAHIVNEQPLLSMPPTIIGVSETAPIQAIVFGVPNGAHGTPSGGPGGGGGMGGGDGTGIGDFTGPSIGNKEGPGGGASGDSRILGPITSPVLQWKTEPEYTEDARRAKIQGTVVLVIDVDVRGQAQNIRIRQSLGFGLDERAVEAVRQWKFKPGSQNGKPIPTQAVVEVNFRLL